MAFHTVDHNMEPITRVLRELRKDGLVTFQQGKVTFDDFDRLVAISESDLHYLDHEGSLMK